MFEFSRFFIPSKFVSEEKLKILTQFSNTSHSFIKLQTFSFIKPHETHFFITNCKNLFSTKSHEIHLGIEWDLFLHDIEWKSYHIKSCSIFLVFGRIFITSAWIWMFSHFVKFVSLSAFSTQNHIRIRNQVQSLSKYKIKLLESFHHL